MHEHPPKRPRRSRRGRRSPSWILLGGGVVVVLVLAVVIAYAATVFIDDGTGTGTADRPGDDGPREVVDLGEPGTIGQWRTTVDGIGTASTYTNEFTEERAHGEFALVDVTVENTGNEPGYFDSSAISLVDDEGNIHESSTTIEDDALFLEQLDPGDRASGTAVVDVPEGTEIAEVRVKDTAPPHALLVVRVEGG
ncbi:DUF4352 domain-containing protein [Nocardiopsis sp. ATB16-24]|uniref:DUF4352 domain-containing protein n=1 Tax=Nocardiopsis sp. ATB16-24 TaxID=3019555 RepID=UPI002553A488|nr:DUF4352 domain-containing protein [Nocardiopsis sp. ATB16-24]